MSHSVGSPCLEGVGMDSRCGEFAAMFKALSEPLRLRLLSALPVDGDARSLCVCDLARKFGISQPCLSHHLTVLRNAGLVGFEKDGCSCFYFVESASLQDRLSEFQQKMWTQ